MKFELDIDSFMFRKLNKKEEKDFRRWARDNFKLNTEIDDGWHPVVRDECRKMNEENVDNS